MLGTTVGLNEGMPVGLTDCKTAGFIDGVGWPEGCLEGGLDGCEDGCMKGRPVG